VFNSNGPTMSTCKCNTMKLNVTNKMCVKNAINARLQKLMVPLTQRN